MVEEIIDGAEEIKDLAETATETGGVGAGMLVATAAVGSLIAAGAIAGAKAVSSKITDIWSRRKAKKALDAAVEATIEQEEVTETAEK